MSTYFPKNKIRIYIFLIDAMQKRDKSLQDAEALSEAWQIVKESVRQLKHDDKRNKVLRVIRNSNVNATVTNPSSSKNSADDPTDKSFH